MDTFFFELLGGTNTFPCRSDFNKNTITANAFGFVEGDEMKCRECGDEIYEYEDGLCWYCEEDANDPDPYVDDSLNEVSMGRFDDDPPEW